MGIRFTQVMPAYCGREDPISVGRTPSCVYLSEADTHQGQYSIAVTHRPTELFAIDELNMTNQTIASHSGFSSSASSRSALQIPSYRILAGRTGATAETVNYSVFTLIALFPSFWPVMAAQVLVGGTSSVFVPAICAMSLGIVGRAAFDTRQGRNQTFNSAGNVTAALSMGLLGYLVSNRSIFFFVVALAVPTIFVLLLIRPAEIDYEVARGANEGEKAGKAESVWVLFKDRPLVLFLVCAVMFHFANAAMLPLLGELLAKGQGRSSMLFMSACVVTTQFVIALIASWSGRKAGTWGRKPLLLIAFAVLPIRGVLYTLTSNTALLVAIQVMDGVGAGIFGVMSVLVIADLTRGTGRFNLTLGAISTAVGIGAALSQVIAGSIVHHAGYRAGFLFLAGVASAALAILYFFMPETGKTRLATE